MLLTYVTQYVNSINSKTNEAWGGCIFVFCDTSVWLYIKKRDAKKYYENKELQSVRLFVHLFFSLSTCAVLPPSLRFLHPSSNSLHLSPFPSFSPSLPIWLFSFSFISNCRPSSSPYLPSRRSLPVRLLLRCSCPRIGHAAGDGAKSSRT